MKKSSYPGLIDLGVELDTEKAGAWNGGLFHVNAHYTYGRGTPDDSGSFIDSSSINAYDTLRLYEAWYQHTTWDGRLSVRLGQVALDEEFATSDLAATLLVNNFGYSGIVSAFDGHSQFAVAGLAARILLEPRVRAAPGAYLMGAVGEGNPDGAVDQNGGPLNTTGVRYDFQFGLVAALEAGYRLDPDHGWNGLPGVYKAGCYVHAAEGRPTPSQAFFGSEVVENQVVYLRADQWVWTESKEPSQGLALFA
ncbi:MAG: carbohydrate porin [Candidatus Methylacidiphilales bacterium]|nr:carbohydrate porin [Candidatus Methylacidiphilales bacterium]